MVRERHAELTDTHKGRHCKQTATQRLSLDRPRAWKLFDGVCVRVPDTSVESMVFFLTQMCITCCGELPAQVAARALSHELLTSWSVLSKPL